MTDTTETWNTWPDDLPAIERPGGCCPMCETPGGDGTTCGRCIARQEAAPDDPGFITAWLAEEPRTRRRLLAVQHGTDPWTGHPCAGRQYERAEVTAAGMLVTRKPVHAALVPRTHWDPPDRDAT